MQIFLVILLFTIGLILIIWGGNLLVNGAESISDITGIPKVIIGATLVSFMTTLPEFMVTVFASATGSKEIAVGNATGSMFFNFLVIGGLLFLFKPKVLNKKDFLNKIIILLVSILLLIIFCIKMKISFINAIILLLVFFLFIIINGYTAFKSSKNIKNNKCNYKTKKVRIFNTIFLFVLGGAMVAFGAKLMVTNGELLGVFLGISSHIIGITIVSMGTSLPELVTGIISIKNNTPEISLGNIIGANIINATLLLGTAGIISNGELSVKPDVCFIVLPVLLVTTLILGVMVYKNKKCSKFFGIINLILAVGYYVYLFLA